MCLTCQKEYTTNGNTSNLRDHLKRFHPNLKDDGPDTTTDAYPLQPTAADPACDQ